MPARLRPLEVAAYTHSGQALVRLRDPLGVCAPNAEATGLVLARAAWEVARRIGDEHGSRGPDAAPGLAPEAARKLVEDLSELRLFDDETCRAEIARAASAFAALGARPATGAGYEYENDATDLRIRLAGQVANDWDMPAPPDLSGIWVPASGLRERGALFARAYAAVRHHARTFERVLLVGLLPAPLGPRLVPLAKDLETPFGTLAHDPQGGGGAAAAEDAVVLAHRPTRVLERQALFLQLLLPRVPVVPVLVTSSPRPPAEPPADLAEALDALRDVLALPGRTLVVAACDLAELPGETGPTPSPPSGRMVHGRRGLGEGTGWIVTGTAGERLRAEDGSLVDALTRAAAEEVWGLAATSENAQRRAGAPLFWLTARLMGELRARPAGEPVRGSLLGYQQSGERTGLVSSAAIVFH